MSIVKLMANTSFGGTGSSVRVGGRTFPIPERTRVHHVRDVLAYVLDEDHGGLYAFTPAGQVTVPAELVDALRAKYFPETDSTK